MSVVRRMPTPAQIYDAIEKADREVRYRSDAVGRERSIHLNTMRDTLDRHQPVHSGMGSQVCAVCCVAIDQLPIRLPRMPAAWPCDDVQNICGMLDLMEAW